MARCLRHRGPDQNGIWTSGAVSLAAVRLKIIDLAGGEQPMRAGGAVLVYNGEIYNHRELRSELESRGRSFESHCDTEVVLHAFLEWGTSSFAKLRGMFAFAIWLESEKKLFLVRDRMGIKPLYHRLHGPDILFGSELKTIFARRDLDRRIDLSALNLFLSLNYIPGDRTLVEDIRKVPPGHWLEWQAGRLSTNSYWELRFAPRPISLPEAQEELDTLLRSSVAEHLISDVPLGVWSSGGLDSTTVLHYAAQAAGRRLKTFSVSFPGRKFDESRYFREVSRHYGTDHHEFELNAEPDLPTTVEAMSFYSDEPGADAGALPVWFLSKMCRSQVTVALSGEGADELFGGYNTYLADRYARALRSLPRFIRHAALAASRKLPASDEKIGLEYKINRMLAGSLMPPAEAHFFWNGTFAAEERARLLLSEAFRANSFDGGPEGVGPLNRFLYVDQRAYLVDDILNKCDRMSMAHSLEVRPPFLDHRIVEFAARLPENMKIRGSTLKFLLRRLMRGKLPAAVLSRPKEGFDIPAHHWFRTVLRPMLLDVVSESAVRETGLFHWAEVEAVMNAHFSRRANYGYHLWGLLTLFLWIKRWRIETGHVSRREPAALITSN